MSTYTSYIGKKCGWTTLAHKHISTHSFLQASVAYDIASLASPARRRHLVGESQPDVGFWTKWDKESTSEAQRWDDIKMALRTVGQL